MPDSDMLKIAFELGLREAVERLEVATPDAHLVKEAIFKKMWGGLKRMAGKGSKAAPEAVPKKIPTPTAPVHPGASATKEQLGQHATANTEYAAKRLEQAGYNPTAGRDAAAKFTEKAGPEGQEWLKTVGEAGDTGMLRGGLMGPAGVLAPTVAGAGVGYAADGREGALVGAGLGAGARLGGGALLQKMREAKGFAGVLGKKTPAFREMLGTEVGKRSLMAGGALGAGLGGAGYAAGSASRSPEEPPWYSGAGMGLTPQQTQELSQMAMPLLSEQLGLDPSVVQALGAQYGFGPAEMPMSAEQPAEYYPDEAAQPASSGYEYY